MDVYANSDRIMDEAITLAKYYDAKITGIHVVEIQPTLSNGDINPSEGNKAKKIMLTIKESCEKRGIQFAFEIPYGTASSEIAKFTEKEKVDLVVVGSKGLSGLKGRVLGSVSNSILHDSNVSVFLVK